MKSLRLTYIIPVAAILLIPSGARAANESHKGSLNLSNPVRVSGTEVPAGSYQVKWQGDGPTAKVDIVSHGKVVASANARVETLKQKPAYDSNDETQGANGQKVLHEVQFAGQPYALNFTGASGSAGAASGGNSN